MNQKKGKYYYLDYPFAFRTDKKDGIIVKPGNKIVPVDHSIVLDNLVKYKKVFARMTICEVNRKYRSIEIEYEPDLTEIPRYWPDGSLQTIEEYESKESKKDKKISKAHGA